MATRTMLNLQDRQVVGKKVKQLRRQGILPATVYGKGVGPFAVQLEARTFQDLYRKSGRSTLIDLDIPGQKAISAFIHSIQRHPVSRQIIHVDFLAVDLKTNVTVSVPLHLIGTSPLVALGDAILNQALNSVSVTALPTDIPSHIDYDISSLDSFDKSVHVSDLQLPENVTMATDGDELVANLSQPRQEEPETVEEEAPAEPELVRDRDKDEDEDEDA